MFFGTLFTLPDTSTLLADIGTTSAPIVNDFLPVIFIVVGIALGIFIVGFIVNLFMHHPWSTK